MTETNKWNERRYTLTGFLTLAFLIFGMGGWGAFSNIRGAVVANGLVEVETNRQIVQHPIGGVVGQLMVNDGDKVEAGQLLLRLDDTLDRSELNIIESQLYSLEGIKARIEAEQIEAPEITFDPEMLERAKSDPAVAQIVSGQKQLITARRATRDQKIGQLTERKNQTLKQIEGLEAKTEALQKQLTLIGDQVKDQKNLLTSQLTQKSKLQALLSDQAQLEGNISESQASVAQSRATVAELELAILGVSSQMREESITAMPDTEARIAELKEKRNAKLEVLSRMDVRAPVGGVVFGMTVHAVRSVIRAAEPVLYLIPQDVGLVINTQIPPAQIDQVHVGQDVAIHLTNFDRRKTPELRGTVTLVSADVAKDERTGAMYYTAKVTPNKGEFDKLKDDKIIPGMQVETFIQTSNRTPLEYLTKPMADYFDKAFRER